ncbi:MFS transporter, partial [Leucobacter soli]|uniref:MFS transporter n=1 Tax=Leucobacter soli TaxID=2812850 RepID=UPI00360655F5
MPTAQPRLTAGLLAALGLLAATSALATDLYLSSIPSIAADLQTSPSRVQLTLSLFFFGLGAGQLVLGPLSDSLGRRPVLIAGTAVFTTASVATVFSPTIEVLIALRLVQGISGAAGIVLARAIAADLSRGENAVKALSLIAMVVGVAPLVAPPVGSLAHELWGWRGVLAALAVTAASMLL